MFTTIIMKKVAYFHKHLLVLFSLWNVNGWSWSI